ncbi:hypothetical protein BM1_10022 [Bipolaris maydis]|nr:hypothetical protein BM1_10022 [Bipolaris maydis]
MWHFSLKIDRLACLARIARVSKLVRHSHYAVLKPSRAERLNTPLMPIPAAREFLYLFFLKHYSTLCDGIVKSRAIQPRKVNIQ